MLKVAPLNDLIRVVRVKDDEVLFFKQKLGGTADNLALEVFFRAIFLRRKS